MRTLVIGASNVDIIGTSKNALLDYESNVGNISIALGGVAKNIAVNLHYLGADVSFLTLIGTDNFAAFQKSTLNQIGISYQPSIEKDVPSSIYMAVHDHTGDMAVALNAMDDVEALTKKDFDPFLEYMEGFDVFVFDTNLSKETLTYLIKYFQHKVIYVDGVSQTKVHRIEDVLPYIDLLKINQYELNALLKEESYDIIEGVKRLGQLGLNACMVSDGDHPITYTVDQQVFQSVTEKKQAIKSTMGAGDALFSGTIYTLLHENNMHKAVEFGKKVASKTMDVYEACNKDIFTLIDL